MLHIVSDPVPLSPQTAIELYESSLTQVATLGTTLFRTYGYRHAKSGKWRVVVQGRRSYDVPTHLNLTKRLMLRGLVKRLQLPSEAIQSPTFQQRVAGFLVGSQAGHKIHLQLGDQSFSIRRRTRASGLFSGRVNISNHEVNKVLRNSVAQVECASLTLSVQDFDEPTTTQVFLADTHGITIVSDIDDTLKQTDVTSRARMLARTFVDPFESIEGMAELYQNWQASHNAMFQYVSSSPWQLYQQLETFLDEFQFPAGSIHLRWFSLKAELFKKWKLARKRRGKAAVIRTLMKRMPQRKFLLVGDSGEHDPEIYTHLAEQFPESVLGIVIRDLVERPLDKTRLRTMKKQLGFVPCTVFREPKQLHGLLESWAPSL